MIPSNLLWKMTPLLYSTKKTLKKLPRIPKIEVEKKYTSSIEVKKFFDVVDCGESTLFQSNKYTMNAFDEEYSHIYIYIYIIFIGEENSI